MVQRHSVLFAAQDIRLDDKNSLFLPYDLHKVLRFKSPFVFPLRESDCEDHAELSNRGRLQSGYHCSSVFCFQRLESP